MQDHVEIIREVFRYSKVFQDRTFVLQLDDAVVNCPSFSSMVRDLVLLHQNGIRIILVAGATHRIDEVLTRYGVDTETYRGVRISSEEAIPFIKMAAFDVANRIMTLLSGHGVNAVIGNWVRAKSLGVVDGVDYEDAGTVHRIRVDLIQGVVGQGSIPILPCIGWSASGRSYNLSSRELATDLAAALGADKLFFVATADAVATDGYEKEAGVDENLGGDVSRLNIDQAERFVETNLAAGRREDDFTLKLIALGLRAARSGVERVHIVDGCRDGVILQEIFSNFGVGLMIHADRYHNIREMHREDVSDVMRLMAPLVRQGVLIPRSADDITDRIGDYIVFETDGVIHGCGALHSFDDGQGEIAAIAVDEKSMRYGIGQRIVTYLLGTARSRRLRRVFVLTTQSSDWFEKLGFVPGALKDLPASKLEKYDEKRKSRILLFELSPGDEG